MEGAGRGAVNRVDGEGRAGWGMGEGAGGNHRQRHIESRQYDVAVASCHSPLSPSLKAGVDQFEGMLKTMVSMAAASLPASQPPPSGGAKAAGQGGAEPIAAAAAATGAAMEARFLSTAHFISQVSARPRMGAARQYLWHYKILAGPLALLDTPIGTSSAESPPADEISVAALQCSCSWHYIPVAVLQCSWHYIFLQCTFSPSSCVCVWPSTLLSLVILPPPPITRRPSQIGTKAAIKKGILAFAELWIYGSGCPRLTLERHYLRGRNALELRVVQSGGAASRRSAERASKKHHSGADESSHGAVKVGVWVAACPLVTAHP